METAMAAAEYGRFKRPRRRRRFGQPLFTVLLEAPLLPLLLLSYQV